MHPDASGAALGEGSLRDFRYFVSNVARLRGGVYLNCGSAVVLPEVFLKAVALVAQPRHRARRPDDRQPRFHPPLPPADQRRASRPPPGSARATRSSAITRLMIPLLAAALIEREGRGVLGFDGFGGRLVLVRPCLRSSVHGSSVLVLRFGSSMVHASRCTLELVLEPSNRRTSRTVDEHLSNPRTRRTLRTRVPQDRVIIRDSGGVAQLVRACGSYPQGPGFKSLHRHHFLPNHGSRRSRSCERAHIRPVAARRTRPGGAVRRADSIALLHLLRELHAAGRARGRRRRAPEPRPAGRRPTPTRRSAASWRQSLGVPFDGRSGPTSARCAATGAPRSRTPGDARATRFSSAPPTALGADAIATGHTRDDQAETFLLQLIRGAGPRGLAAISPKRGRVCRPLIDIRRDELRAYLDAGGCRFRDDESNADLAVHPEPGPAPSCCRCSSATSRRASSTCWRARRPSRADDEDRLQAEAIELAAFCRLS